MPGEGAEDARAVDESDGSIVGSTELVTAGDGTGDAQHHGTVLPEHRGHGVAHCMKATLIHQARERQPDLAGLLTDTTDSNPHMRRVNDTPGCLPTHTAHEYPLDPCRSFRPGAHSKASYPDPAAAARRAAAWSEGEADERSEPSWGRSGRRR